MEQMNLHKPGMYEEVHKMELKIKDRYIKEIIK